MDGLISVNEARAYAREHWPSPVVCRPLEALLDNCPRVEVEPDRQWISVKDRLPYNKTPLCETVLVCTILGVVMPGFLSRAQWYVMRPENDYCDAIDGDVVTHWTPLPKPPKEG